MDRRQFLASSGFLAALGPTLGFAAPTTPVASTAGAAPLAPTSTKSVSIAQTPVLLPGLPPLDHKGNMDIRVRVRSAMTNGAFSSVECAVAPKKMGPAPHAHKELDELMYVVSGTASVLVGDDVVHIAAGGWHLRPHQIKHTFWNASKEPLLFFDMYFNQPFEEYLEKIFHELTPENGYPEGSEKKRAIVAGLTERFGLIRPPGALAQRQAIMAEYGLT